MSPSLRSLLVTGLLAGLAASRASLAQTVLASGGHSATLVCAGQDAAVRGDANHVTFVGPCRTLRIDGNRNVVAIELGRPGTVHATGDYNQVVYTPAARPPVTTLLGYYNQVVPGPLTTPADASPGTLLLDGTLGQRDMPCGGLDVVIRESNARYVLRGGCRSVTVQGMGDVIAAELMPSARLVIGGTGVVVNYVLVAQGAPPTVQVTALGARATHIARFGETAFVLPTSPGLPR